MRAHMLSILLVATTFLTSSDATDTIDQTTTITGNQTLVSAGGIFRLGFFTPPGSSDGGAYIGIWYASIPVQTVVWVANRQNPVVRSPGVLRLSPDGHLVIIDGQNTTVWSSAAPTKAMTSRATAQLLDSGNFVLSSDGSGAPRSVAWQSFDYPTDTHLPGMRLGVDLKAGIARNITSYRSPTDPAPGTYTFKLVMGGMPEFFLFRGAEKIYASGPWNGASLTGVQDKSEGYTFTIVSNPDETYYAYSMTDPSMLSRFVVDGTSGQLQSLVWGDGAWSTYWYYPADPCDSYNRCGAFGYCDMSQATRCSCLPGFRPKSEQQRILGCVRKTDLSSCPGAGDGFWPVNQMKLPDATNATVHAKMTLDDCRQLCLGSCSCTAYSAANVSGGVSRGCVIWAVDLLDMRQYTVVVQDVYIRLAQSEVDALTAAAKHPNRRVVIGVSTALSGLLLLGAVVYYFFWRNKASTKRQDEMAPSIRAEPDVPPGARKHSALRTAQDRLMNESRMSSEKDLELPLFDLEVILAATDNFSADRKIGQGGFGPVYMAKLEDGQEVAVKRLSKKSVQGVVEFKNEVKLIAKLQHRNLVRLLGCCIDDHERMLVYEFMHNNSLDTFIFDEGKRKLLEWKSRFEIILGIARGLLYLHEDSRVRIIHRDLKASNVLLDRNMIPKISDFGIARMFGGDQTTAYTAKVIGTYGYMSPEYAMDGVFSMKSDIYSFGVLTLEIITGKKNRGFYDEELDLNLLGYAWKLWKEGQGVDLLDEAMGDTIDHSVALRCIQVALLCVEVHPRNRPLMSSVVTMLSSENATLVEPNEPGVNIGKSTSDTDYSQTHTATNFTGTAVDARIHQL
ncbi:receptor-like serine/threonine-protein kinase SD1-8 isoform X1 [Lolium rigidum]|uniref:receptor-like serine/threonine-protein kinase SD1-8 isoform X1 n=1 Tax=Lolium rigidum TaxID=89674 RepID=UPI001F5CFAC8|nr:receptor-like serine/threonine-protein kinase SD1-8 isoform X1 [Lolium rigidum]